MKLFILTLTLLFSTSVYSQESELLIPKEAVTVLSLNNFSLLQKVSLEELIQYEFMYDIQQEIFDGSTQGKTIKEAGIDFNQKLNIFYGKSFKYEISGFTFGISDKTQLFEAFDDFEKVKSKYPNVEHYASYFNQLFIKGSSAILIRVEPIENFVTNITDSIWYARGNDYPWFELDYYEEQDSPIKMMEEVEEGEEYYEELIFSEDSTATPPPPGGFPEAEEVETKNYFELQDSVRYELEQQFTKEVCSGLFKANQPLIDTDKNFAAQITHDADGVFYLDNSRNFQKDQGLWYFRKMLPGLYQEMKDLYTGNIIQGDIFLLENSIEFKVKANYGDELGSIYKELNDSKFDKNILKYIHQDNSAYFTYNIDLQQAYEQAYEVILPILDKETNPRVVQNVITLELFNELINKDALFGAYKGSMFLTYNGIQKVRTRKIEYTYDEETFEYSHTEVEAEEDMPIITMGFSTERSDIPEKILKHLSKIDTSIFVKHNEYWEIKNAILDAAPLYLINRNDLFIFTNDQNLVKSNLDGYGKNALNGKKAREIKKNGFLYGEVDWENTIDKLPTDIFSEKQNEILDAMRGKTGKIKLTSSETTQNETNFNLTYTFNGEYENAGKYILDLINSVYIISK